MPQMNRVLLEVPPSGIRKFFDIVSEMKDAISLGVGEPDFTTPWHVCEAAIYSIERGQTHYTSNWGTKELRYAIADYLEGRFSVSYHPEKEILITVGASEGIDLACRAILNPGDEVLIPDPSYVSYAPSVRLNMGVPVPVPTYAENDFCLQPGDILPLINEKTKAIILPYPNNPTGAVLDHGQVAALARVLRDKDIFIISDEIYAELTYTGEAHASIAEYDFLKDRIILLSGFSKSMAMTGWRVGFACGPHDVMQQMCKIHQYTMLCAPVMAQVAALEGLREGKKDGYASIERMKREYNRRRRLMVARFNDMGLDCFEPRGAFYTFPSIARFGSDSQQFCEGLLRAQKVATVPGDAFGAAGNGFMRCSYASSLDNINEALRRIEAYLKTCEARA